MATACGPEAPAVSIHAIDTFEPDTLHGVDADMTADTTSQRVAPPPNPTFSFPARPDTQSAPSSFARSAGRRTKSALDGSSNSYQLASERMERPGGRAALPSFSFNPGASLPPDPNEPMPSPPLSPQSPRTMPSGEKPIRHGHRRGGSEFVGGRLREGNSIAVMSGSPTKAESGFLGPNLGPPRRGHRRGVSSALSTNDLSLLPPPQHDFSFKGSSAPNSPTNFDKIPILSALESPPKAPESCSAPDVDQDVKMQDAEEVSEDTSAKPTTRARVGFSDTLEFIPRPLSLVSTDTSSTITAKPSHGVSGSISSVITGASPERESPVPTRSSSRNTADSRPSTAGAILESTTTIQTEEPDRSPKRRNSIPALLQVDLAESPSDTPTTPSPTKAPKRWSFFGLDTFTSHGSPNKARPRSSSSGDSATRVVSAGSSSEHGSDSQTDPETKATKKKTKKRKVVKGWAGSILPRKPRDKRSKYAVRPPTPPASVLPPEEEDDAMEIEETTTRPTPPPIVTITESQSPPRPAPRPEEVSSPMIDLDAALGPFNTPLPNNPEWDAAQRAAGNVGRRRLHSAQGMRGFSGPGMHYHRRAESAPDLPPFEISAASLHRFGSSSTMADVFEEDEDEGEPHRLKASSQSGQDSDGDVTPPAVAPEPKDPVRSIRRKSSGVSDRDQSSIASIRAQRSRTSLHENVIAEEPGMRFRLAGSDVSGSPRLSPRPTLSKDMSSFELGTPPVPGAITTPVSPHSASFASSPRSPMSADTQRLSTAPSSVHEETSFHSLLMGEPGPEVRLSVDYDIPSLTSSNSTTTRDSTFPSQLRMSQPTPREPRPLSVSSAAFGRRRSSLASLSRLISSSHGERSKLSMEVTLDNEAESRKPRSKTKRFGRLVQFWKPKDGASS